MNVNTWRSHDDHGNGNNDGGRADDHFGASVVFLMIFRVAAIMAVAMAFGHDAAGVH